MSSPPPEEISGVVKESGNGVDGAIVFAVRTSDTNNLTLEGQTTTATDGTYSISNLPPGEYHAVVQWTDSNGDLYNAYSKPGVSVDGQVAPSVATATTSTPEAGIVFDKGLNVPVSSASSSTPEAGLSLEKGLNAPVSTADAKAPAAGVETAKDLAAPPSTAGTSTPEPVLSPSFQVTIDSKWIGIPDGVVDNFEDFHSDPAGPYEEGEDITDYYGGDTGGYNRQQSDVFADDWSLQGQSVGDTPKSISSTGGLPRYPEQDETFRCRLKGDKLDVDNTAANVQVFWFTQSETARPDGYSIHLQGANNFRLFRVDSGSFTQLAGDDNQTISAGTEYEVEIDHDNQGNITVKLFDDGGSGGFDNELTSISATDTNYTSGGIAFEVNNRSGEGDHTAVWDEYRVVE